MRVQIVHEGAGYPELLSGPPWLHVCDAHGVNPDLAARRAGPPASSNSGFYVCEVGVVHQYLQVGDVGPLARRPGHPRPGLHTVADECWVTGPRLVGSVYERMGFICRTARFLQLGAQGWVQPGHGDASGARRLLSGSGAWEFETPPSLDIAQRWPSRAVSFWRSEGSTASIVERWACAEGHDEQIHYLLRGEARVVREVVLDSAVEPRCMLRLVEASARPDEVGLCAMVAIGLLLFAHDAYRHQECQFIRQIVLAMLKQLRGAHRAIRELRQVAPVLPARLLVTHPCGASSLALIR